MYCTEITFACPGLTPMHVNEQGVACQVCTEPPPHDVPENGHFDFTLFGVKGLSTCEGDLHSQPYLQPHE